MTRDEHLAWAKERALQYLDEGDLKNGVRSMCSDLSKHPELEKIGTEMDTLYLINRDARQLRAWIEGLN
jgi:hypothetical protein